MNQPLPNHELLSAYLDNEVTAAERARVEQRLATDADYAATLVAWRQQRESMQSLASEKIDVRDRVHAATQAAPTANAVTLKEQTPPKPAAKRSADSGPNRTPVFAVIGTLAALILVGVFLVVPPSDPTTSVAETDGSQAESVMKESLERESPMDGPGSLQADADEEMLDSLVGNRQAETALSNESDEALAGRDGASIDGVAVGDRVQQTVQKRSATMQRLPPTSTPASPPQPHLQSRLNSQASNPSPNQPKAFRKSDVQAADGSLNSSDQFYAGKMSDADRPSVALADTSSSVAGSGFGQDVPTWLVQPKPELRLALTIDQFIAALRKVKIVAKRSDAVSSDEAETLNARQSAELTAKMTQLIGQATPQQMDQLRRLLTPAATLKRVGARDGDRGTTELAGATNNGTAMSRLRSGATQKPAAAAEETASATLQTQRFLFVIEAGDEAATPTVPAIR